MRKSVGVMSWLKASTDAALTLQPASAQVRICAYNGLCQGSDIVHVGSQHPLAASTSVCCTHHHTYCPVADGFARPLACLLHYSFGLHSCLHKASCTTLAIDSITQAAFVHSPGGVA